MSIELNISPEDVNRLVAEAVLKSTIGKAIEDQVAKAVVSLTTSWNNPIEKVVRDEITRIAANVVMTEHADTIKAAVKEKVAEKLSDDLIGKLVAGVLDQIDR